MEGFSSLSDAIPKIKSNDKIDGFFKMTYNLFAKYFISGNNLKIKIVLNLKQVGVLKKPRETKRMILKEFGKIAS